MAAASDGCNLRPRLDDGQQRCNDPDCDWSPTAGVNPQKHITCCNKRYAADQQARIELANAKAARLAAAQRRLLGPASVDEVGDNVVFSPSLPRVDPGLVSAADQPVSSTAAPTVTFPYPLLLTQQRASAHSQH